MTLIKNRLIATLIFCLFSFFSFAGTSTWTGSVNNNWSNSGNWSGGVPSGASDIVVLPASGINTNIVNVPSITLKRLDVTGGNYSLASSSAITMTLSAGASGDELHIESGASLTTSNLVSVYTGNRPVEIEGTFTCNGNITINGTVTISGTANLNSGLTYNDAAVISVTGTLNLTGAFNASATVTIAGSGTVNFPASATCTLNRTVNFQTNVNINGTLTVASGYNAVLNPATGLAAAISSTGLINGQGNVTHNTGSLTINGLVNNGGNFTNTASMTGTGTVEVGGTISNSSTMFGYPGNPPAHILSGFTWKGSAGSDWTNPANWWENAVPVSDGDAVVYQQSNQPVIASNAQACRQLYLHNNAVLTLNPNGQLTANGKTTIKNNSGLIVSASPNNAGSFLDNGNITGGGTATVKRTVTQGQHHYMSTPVNGATSMVFLDDYMRAFDEPAGNWGPWIVPTNIPMGIGTGYDIWTDTTHIVSFTGVPNTGNITVNLTRTYTYCYWTSQTDYNGWNLIGNPYPSAVDWQSNALQLTHVDPTVYYWNGTQYVDYNRVTHLGAGSRYIPEEQGFFVHVTNDANNWSAGTVKFTNGSRVHNTYDLYKEGEIFTDLFTLKSAGNGLSDKVQVHFDQDATSGFDWELDNYKLFGNTEVPQVYVMQDDTTVASVSTRPYDEGTTLVEVGFTCGIAGEYTLTGSGLDTFDPSVRVLLEDLLAHKFTDLRTDSVYEFYHDPQFSSARFVLHFYNPVLSGGNNLQPGKSSARIYSSGNTVYVQRFGDTGSDARVEIYDLLGRRILQTSVSGELTSLPLTAGEGCYVVSVLSRQDVVTQKVFVN